MKIKITKPKNPIPDWKPPIKPLKLVKGHGPEDAEIMIVSDYPSKEEITCGKALQGSSARLVGNYLKDNDYNLDKCFKTVFIKSEFHWPKGKKARVAAWETQRKDYEFLQSSTWERDLAKEILDINPNVILSLGDFPSRYLTGRQVPIGKIRGSVLPLSDRVKMDTGNPSALKQHIRVVPVLSPREIFAKWSTNFYTTLDYGRAIAHRTRLDPLKEKSLIWIVRDYNSFQNWWNDRGRKAEFLTLDIETYAGFITCISFCADGYEALSVPLMDKNMSMLERAYCLKLIAKILRSPIPKVNQNIKYDHHMCEYWGLQCENIAGDTMVLGHTIYPELPKGLDFYTSIYTDIAYYKDEGRDFNPKQGWDVLYIYNAKDALTAWQIYKKQIDDAKELKVWDFYQQKVWPCYDVYKRMDDRGVRVDPVEQKILSVKYSEMLDVRHADLKRMSGVDLNFNSPQQVANLVYTKLDIPYHFKINKEGKKVVATDEETLEEIILNEGKSKEVQDILWGIIWCRKIYKVLEYVETPIHLDGRLHTIAKITGTKSGRTSNSETVDKLWFFNKPGHPWYDKNHKNCPVLEQELGRSLQTLPKHGFEIGVQRIGKDIRKMYVPSPGFSFAEGDGGQAEARVVCVLAEDWDALAEMDRKEFKRNPFGLKDDLHVKTAMLVLQKIFEEITEDDRQDFGKKPRHAGNYDMGPGRLSLLAHISLHAAIKALAKFHGASPKIREIFHTTVRTLVTNTRELRTCHGRLRQFFNKLTAEYYKEAYSFYPQAVVSDHTKFSVVTPMSHKWCHDDMAYFLSESHDSAFFEVRNCYLEPFCIDFKACGETPIPFNQGSFIRDFSLVIPEELKTSTTNWYEMKDYKIQ